MVALQTQLRDAKVKEAGASAQAMLAPAAAVAALQPAAPVPPVPLSNLEQTLLDENRRLREGQTGE